MKTQDADILVIGAGPVGLMCSYLGKLCGLEVVVIDKTEAPLEVGRADALNARTLQLFEIGNLFEEIYPQGKPVNTSSVWENGKFISRESSWWDEIEGCFHKHFLMIGQSYVEKMLDRKLSENSAAVKRSISVVNIEENENGCLTTLSSGEKIQSKYLIGADGIRSFVRNHFKIPFEIERPQIVWAVIDGITQTDFKKVPEIIVFQAETSDVAWIPREGELDRFYVRMDTKEFTQEEVVAKINKVISPHILSFKHIEWFSQFSVKESVADSYFVRDRVFLAGDACHVHSVNGGQGLNTGLADAFNLIWKLNMVINHNLSKDFLKTYESERKPVAKSVIESSGELVRTTKFSDTGTHARDYVAVVKKRAGNITGMGIRYEGAGDIGTRLFDFKVADSRIYSMLDYSKFSLIIFGEPEDELKAPAHVNVIRIPTRQCRDNKYAGKAVLVRPDSYIKAIASIADAQSLL